MSFKYLFRVLFKDGEVYDQNPEDLPKEGTQGSSFSYVAKKLNEVARLDLYTPDFQTWIAGVNLCEGGTFTTADTVPPHISGDLKFPGLPLDNPFRLIYFRRNTVDFQGTEETNRDVEYHIGWQTTFNGKNYQQILTVN